MTLAHKSLKYFLYIFITIFLISCSVLQENSKSSINDGYFKLKEGKENTPVYVQKEEDSINIYQISIPTAAEPYPSSVIHLGKTENSQVTNARFLTSSFDIDLLTIPFKYRFSTKDVQPQLNTEIAGVIYLGYRTDRYKFKNSINPLNQNSVEISHFGYSFGVFSGIGNTFMSPTTTFNRIEQEYDGIVWSSGVAAIIGLNNLTMGVALGFDRLMDDNSGIWIYQNKPWIGLTLGLNLY